MCGLTHVTVTVLCSSSSLLCILNSDWATENEAGRSVSVNGNEEPRWRDLSPIQFSCNCNYSLIENNKTPVHSTWGSLRVYVACPTPRLNLSSELRPSGNNIQYTFLTGSVKDTTVMCAIVVCHRTFGRDCHHEWNECNWFAPHPWKLSGSVSKYNTIPINNLIY